MASILQREQEELIAKFKQERYARGAKSPGQKTKHNRWGASDTSE